MEVIKEFFGHLINLFTLLFVMIGIATSAWLIIKYRTRYNRYAGRRSRARQKEREKLRKEGMYEDEIDDLLDD